MSSINNNVDSSSSKQWEELPLRLDPARDWHGAVVLLNNNILITGGWNVGDGIVLGIRVRGSYP